MKREGLAACVQAAQGGSLRHFELLVRRFQEMAVGYSRVLLGDSHLAEDAAQDAFALAYTRLDQLQDPKAFPGWFRQIVFSRCMRYRQRKDGETAPAAVEAQLADPQPLPDAVLAGKEQTARVGRVLASLNEEEQTVLTLHYIRDHSLREMAAFLEVSTTTVKNRLRSARQKMHRRLLALDHLQTTRQADYFHTSTPEAQGMDSAHLLEMCRYLDESGKDFHNILVMRHGHLVFEANYFPYQPQTKHGLAGATIAVMAALIGIAIDKGYLPGVDTPVLDLLPEHRFANMDERKKAMQLKHLLSMTSGLDWRQSWLKDNPEWVMFKVDDPVQFILDRPMAHEPGAVWNYSGGNAHLLSAILQRATGKKAFDFADEHLFQPLGFADLLWEQHVPSGANIGCSALYMRPRDMAKFAQLYLQGGRWGGEQVIPAEWIGQAHTKHAVAKAKSAVNFGYNWWLLPEGDMYKAWGYGGEYLAVLPDLDMVVVCTGGIEDHPAYPLHVELCRDYIVAAVNTHTALPEKPRSIRSLNQWTADKTKGPALRPHPGLPAMARTVAGKKYGLETNSFGLEWFALHFADEGQEATLSCDLRFGEFCGDFAVGLDGVERATPVETYRTSLACKGQWENERTFAVDLLIVGLGYRCRFVLCFDGEGVEVRATSVIERLAEDIHGRLQEKEQGHDE
ncbi:MAG: sigma-70 family RNA polymerase sigma factor [Candidatus Latescibacteria bacterium]|nr:sigma-70 family RNA polymerase sigma factor [Candidatus Latescibacterota bacterium]